AVEVVAVAAVELEPVDLDAVGGAPEEEVGIVGPEGREETLCQLLLRNLGEHPAHAEDLRALPGVAVAEVVHGVDRAAAPGLAVMDGGERLLLVRRVVNVGVGLTAGGDEPGGHADGG